MTLNSIFAWDRGSNLVIVVQSNTYHVLLAGLLVTQDIRSLTSSTNLFCITFQMHMLHMGKVKK